MRVASLLFLVATLPAGTYPFLAGLPALAEVEHTVPVALCVGVGG
jgi:hypothetical protein